MSDESSVDQSTAEQIDDFSIRARAFYEISRSRLDEQSRWVGSLDTRLATAFGLNTVIVALLGAALVIGQDEFPVHVAALSVIVLCLFASATFCGYMSFRESAFERRPVLLDVQSRVRLSVGHQWFMTASDIVMAYHANAELVRKKERWTKLAIGITAVNALAVSVTAIATIAF